MEMPVLYGAPYSVYVRAVRMTLAEKGVTYRLEPVDVFAPGGPPDSYMALHPFGKIPAFAHAGGKLYEAVAIERYIDEAFEGPALQPADPFERSRMVQILSILDSYAYRTWVWNIYVECCERKTPNEELIAASMERAATCLDAIEAIGEPETVFFLSDTPTLADLHAAPMIDLFQRSEEGRDMIGERPGWKRWWETVSALSSYATANPGN